MLENSQHDQLIFIRFSSLLYNNKKSLEYPSKKYSEGL